jgi:hypothetical protein
MGRKISRSKERNSMTYRYVNTGTWNDPWFEALSPNAKFLFLYLFTNDHTNQAGIMQLSVKRIAYDTGISQENINTCLGELTDKVLCRDSWLWVKNFFKYQGMNASFTVSAIRCASSSPFFSEWCEHYNINPADYKKKEPKKNITEQSRAEQEVSPPPRGGVNTVATPSPNIQDTHTTPPVSPFAKTTNDVPSDFLKLSYALGKPQVSRQELIIWQELKSLTPPCRFEDVEKARKAKAKNNLSYLKNVVCECRDERIKSENDPNRPKTNKEWREEFEAMARR